MAGQPTLILVDNPIAVNKYELGPELWVGVLELLESLQQSRQLSKSQEPWNVGKVELDELEVLVNNLLLLIVVNHEGSTSNIVVLRREAQVNSGDVLECLGVPSEVICLNNFLLEVVLLIIPFPLCLNIDLGSEHFEFAGFLLFGLHPVQRIILMNIIN